MACVTAVFDWTGSHAIQTELRFPVHQLMMLVPQSATIPIQQGPLKAQTNIYFLSVLIFFYYFHDGKYHNNETAVLMVEMVCLLFLITNLQDAHFFFYFLCGKKRNQDVLMEYNYIGPTL